MSAKTKPSLVSPSTARAAKNDAQAAADAQGAQHAQIGLELHTKIEMFERTVLELGSEVFGMKSTMSRMRETHERFLGIFKGLKQLLDEKGLITTEDFDAAVDLGEALERFNNSQGEHAAYIEMERLKKTNH